MQPFSLLIGFSMKIDNLLKGCRDVYVGKAFGIEAKFTFKSICKCEWVSCVASIFLLLNGFIQASLSFD